MRTKLLLLAAAAMAASCQQPAGNTETANDSTTVAADTVAAAQQSISGPACFTQVVGKDTAYLQLLTIQNDSVSGKLAYHHFEKDSNKGEIKGTLHNNILELQYQFMSEGTTSTVPAVFKLEGEQAYAGLPGSFDKEGAPVFDKDPARIQFDTIPFVKTTCP